MPPDDDGHGTTLAGVGASADLEVGKWDLLAKIGVTLSNLEEEARDRRNKFERLLNVLPTDRNQVTSGTYPGSGNLVLELGAPERSRYWQVKRIVIGGYAGTDTPAGNAFVYALPRGPVSLAQFTVTALRDFTSRALPQVSYYGTREFMVKDAEKLVIVITNGTVGQLYTCSVALDDYPAVDYPPGGVLYSGIPGGIV